MDSLPVLPTELVSIMVIVAFAIFIFSTELLRVDVAAMLIMTILGLMLFVPGLQPLLTYDVLFSGFSSNAVISIIAVMILGGGLDKTGVMERVAWAIKTIVQSRQNFGPNNLIGMRLRIGRQKRNPNLKTFDLLHLVGDIVKEIFRKEAHEQHVRRLQKLRTLMRRRQTYVASYVPLQGPPEQSRRWRNPPPCTYQSRRQYTFPLRLP